MNEIELISRLLDHCNKTGVVKNLKNTIAIKELAIQYRVDENTVLNTLLLIKNDEKYTTENFKELLHEEYSSEKDIKQWTIYVPINYNLGKRKIIIEGTSIEVISGKSIGKTFKNQPFEKFSVHDKSKDWDKYNKIFDHRDWYFLKYESSGKTLPSAFYHNLDKLECLQGIVNFIKLNGIVRYSFPYSYGKLEFHLGNVVYATSKEKGLEYIEFSTPSHYNINNYQLKEIGKYERNGLTSILKRFENTISTKSIRETLYHCFRLYNAGISSGLKFNAYLVFWQLCEAVCLSSEFGGNTKTVIKRIKFHLNNIGLHGNNMDHTLQALASMRNDMVHRGFDLASQDDIAIMKYISERALSWLLNIEESLVDINQLELYYSMRTVSDKVLRDKNIVIDYIRAERKKR